MNIFKVVSGGMKVTQITKLNVDLVLCVIYVLYIYI